MVQIHIKMCYLFCIMLKETSYIKASRLNKMLMYALISNVNMAHTDSSLA